jgi:plasmid maintenance system antidote protein VapI
MINYKYDYSHLLALGLTVEQIAEALQLTVEQVREIIKGRD